MAELILHRRPNAADRKLQFLVELDGSPVRELAAGKTLAIEVEPGPHTARIYAGRAHCFEFDVVIGSDRNVELEVLSRNAVIPRLGGYSRRPPKVINHADGRPVLGRIVRGRFR